MLAEHMRRDKTGQRRGVLLIVVLALLSLFAIVGITFVFFSSQKAEYARITADAQNPGTTQFPDDGTNAFSAFLASLIYPAIPPTSNAPATSYFNALRGHDLTSSMYGGQPGSTLPWNGIGLFDEDVTAPEYARLNHRQIVNYTAFPGMNVLLDPEYSNPAGRPLNAPPTGVYIPKNAPYTYPDVNNFYLASICPATGEILVPSFHRPQLFGPLDPSRSLDPSNPNWTSPQGKFLTLRPRPAEHPNFPPVPQNPDGTYTGDVQNLRGVVGVQKNDSLWMDIGLPPFMAPNGKRYKPLVAPLILDLNGLLDLSSHGNVLNGGTQAAGAGFGPWEVSLERAFAEYGGNPAEARNLIQARNGVLQNRAGVSQRAFAPWMQVQGQRLPEYMPVPWAGFNGAPALLLPGQGVAGLFRDAPLYAYGYDAHNNPLANHPSLFNPTEWPKTANLPEPRAFSLPDLKLLHFAYAAYRSHYDNLEVRQFASTTFGPNTPFPNIPINTPNFYRRDPAHRNRMIFTTSSYTLDRPAGLGYYFDGTNIRPNPLADLPPVNLNRPLADYRNDTSQPLSPNNVGNFVQAQQDRQNLARDIFVRLVALTLPQVIASWNHANGQYTFHQTIISTHYNDLRSLAQLAVNIVDYIDNDDIMTPFAWDPNSPTEVVWGVERPRLVINEVYSEVTNDPNDPTFGAVPMPAQNPVHVRFWVELHNPTSTPYPAGTDGPLGDGSVPLRLPDAAPAYSVYKLLITQNANNAVSNALRDPENNSGEPRVASQITFDFSLADNTPLQRINPANADPDAGMLVLAAHVPAVRAADEFNPNPNWPAGAPVLTGAPAGMPNSLTYTFPLNGALDANGNLVNVLKDHVVLLQRLANPYLPPGPDNPYITVDFMDHVPTFDAIQRASGANTDRNPKRWDGMAVQPGYDPVDLPAAGDPIVRRHAIGKAQPYAGQCNPQPPAPNTAYPQYSFPQSLVLRQDPRMVNPGVRHTFLRRNSRDPALNDPTFNPGPPASLAHNNETETLMTPYDWLVHLDRPLINTTELLHVQVTKPHLVTHDFLTPRANSSIDKFTGSVQNRLNSGVLSQLYRAFELLRVQPYIAGVPIGGRVPGKINLNTLQDKRVWDALFDAHFHTFDQTFVDDMWRTLIGGIGGRTPNLQNRTAADGTVHPCPVPGATVFDTNSPVGDRPFLPFGIPTLPPGPKPIFGSSSARAYGGTLSLNDTILKLNPATQLPHLLEPPKALHPYQSAEAFRKIFPNVTTVSHNFAVWVTIGYFEVEADIPIDPNIAPGIVFHRLGREYFREVPGDTRHQFFAIVDRSMIAIDPASFRSGGGSLQHAQQRPFFTTLQANAPVGSNTIAIYAPAGYAPAGAGWSEGHAVPITTGQPLVIGIGRAMEIVTVKAVGAPQADGTVVVRLEGPLSFTHHVGDCVSNVVPGNPGPQPNFDPRLPQYQSVVPFWVRLR
jgi:hypothetical protein